MNPETEALLREELNVKQERRATSNRTRGLVFVILVAPFFLLISGAIYQGVTNPQPQQQQEIRK